MQRMVILYRVEGVGYENAVGEAADGRQRHDIILLAMKNSDRSMQLPILVGTERFQMQRRRSLKKEPLVPRLELSSP
jgi:hypothetical protein